jgi:hypothetical protein
VTEIEPGEFRIDELRNKILPDFRNMSSQTSMDTTALNANHNTQIERGPSRIEIQGNENGRNQLGKGALHSAQQALICQGVKATGIIIPIHSTLCNPSISSIFKVVS